nr:helix-turn-helix transcriptional regulator [Kribbella shirazensis]
MPRPSGIAGHPGIAYRGIRCERRARCLEGGLPLRSSRRPRLRGRRDECEKLERLVASARLGGHGVVVLRGAPGIGKSALLEYVAAVAADCRTLHVTGVESQMELAFAGLHEFCEPLLPMLDRLPAPQADALATAFGLRAGTPPDQFLVGLATSTLLSESAGERPLVCMIDDAQWLDHASARTLAFLARRLTSQAGVKAVALVVTIRAGETAEIWDGLPVVVLKGLRTPDAQAMLDSAVRGRIDARVRERILAEAHGNPLALLELPRWFSAAELSFGPALGSTVGRRSLTSRMEEGFLRRLELLPHESRLLLVIAAAEPLGDVRLLWRAAQSMGISVDAARPAETAGLIELRETVRFRHPLVRSVAYRSADVRERQAAHRALAAATDPLADPDRQAWHRASAATGPDEAVAAQLERSADRALAQGGLAAAAAFLERAAVLTPDAGDRVHRRLNAVQAMMHAGTLEAASRLLAVTEHGPLDDLQRARADVLRAQIGLTSGQGGAALPLLVNAARRLEVLDVELAMDSYVDAFTATWFAGHLATDPGARAVALMVRDVPEPSRPRRGDDLLRALAVLFGDGYQTAVPMLRSAIQAFDRDDIPVQEAVRFLWLATVVAIDLRDSQAWDRLASLHLQIARDSGAVSALPLALHSRIFVDLFSGDLPAAAALVQEAEAATDLAESRMTPYGAIGLAAFEGKTERATAFLAAARRDAAARGEGLGVSLIHWANAVLSNSHRHYPAALESARAAATHPEEMVVRSWSLAELVEAAARTGDSNTAAGAAEQLAESARASGTDWALGVAARSEAQLDGPRTEDLYREAVDRLARTNLRVETARTRLLFGEWLRRAGRRLESRVHLRSAHDALAAMGMEAFADRARRELGATGEIVHRQTGELQQELTAQELHIARLAADGLTNAEIASELYISPRTVEWHLRKVFTKLGVTARRQLTGALRGMSVGP